MRVSLDAWEVRTVFFRKTGQKFLENEVNSFLKCNSCILIA